jgi:hypothetical protein
LQSRPLTNAHLQLRVHAIIGKTIQSTTTVLRPCDKISVAFAYRIPVGNMAAKESPIVSAMTLAGPSRADRRAREGSPPAQSKRDKKRQHIRDKIAQLNEKTARDRDPQYREMLQKIQFDASLVSKFNPYADRALDEIETEYQQSAQANAQQRSWLEMTGPGFESFFRAASDCIEQKDFNLAALNVRMRCLLATDQC